MEKKFVIFLLSVVLFIGTLSYMIEQSPYDTLPPPPAINGPRCGTLADFSSCIVHLPETKTIGALVGDAWVLTTADANVMVGSNAVCGGTVNNTGHQFRSIDKSVPHPRFNLRLLRFAVRLPTVDRYVRECCVGDVQDSVATAVGLTATNDKLSKSACVIKDADYSSFSIASGVPVGDSVAIFSASTVKWTLWGLSSKSDPSKFVKVWPASVWIKDTINNYG